MKRKRTPTPSKATPDAFAGLDARKLAALINEKLEQAGMETRIRVVEDDEPLYGERPQGQRNEPDKDARL